MPRIPYLPADIAEPREIVDAIRARRNGKLLNLDRMLLHSPAFAGGWNALLGEVRGKLSLPAHLQELVICAIAVLSGADYEYHHHAPAFLDTGGSEEELAALRNLKNTGEQLLIFSAAERSILKLVCEMTIFIQVNPATFAAARAAVKDDQQLTELVGLISCYNMVARYLVALQIDPEDF